MYTDEDLYRAVEDGILEEDSVQKFREYISNQTGKQPIDEENFRLLTGFNDIFVSMSSYIFLISVGWITFQIEPAFGFFVSAVLSLFLSVFFIQRKRLALPAVLLSLAFMVCITLGVSIMMSEFGSGKSISLFCGLGTALLVGWGHWRVFRVPIIVAVIVASLIAALLTLISLSEAMKAVLNAFIFVFGIFTFLFAMSWDVKDRTRKTIKSDVAFWLHLLAAPLIVHPIFSALGMLSGENSQVSVFLIVSFYVVLAFVSIAVDRRALMVSALFYVVVALSQFLSASGVIKGFHLAMSGLFIGALLLVLSVYWQRSRLMVIGWIPNQCAKYLPPTIEFK